MSRSSSATARRPRRRVECCFVGGGRIEPRNPVEATLAQIWGELLDIQAPVGVPDNLFALGGHSLTATRFVARLADAHGLQLPSPGLR